MIILKLTIKEKSALSFCPFIAPLLFFFLFILDVDLEFELEISLSLTHFTLKNLDFVEHKAYIIWSEVTL